MEKASETIKDKEIILLLGHLGSGKSTTVHFLAGSRMELTKVKLKEGNNSYINHINPSNIDNEELRNVVSSCLAKSETRYITPVRIKLREIGVETDKESIILVDTPGFEASEGVEVDIANGIGITKAVCCTKSVRPVVLIN